MALLPLGCFEWQSASLQEKRMNAAQTRLEQIMDKNNRINSVIKVIAMIFKSDDLYDYDELENGEQVNTFIFTFHDGSELWIDFDGDVYINEQRDTAFNIYK